MVETEINSVIEVSATCLLRPILSLIAYNRVSKNTFMNACSYKVEMRSINGLKTH